MNSFLQVCYLIQHFDYESKENLPVIVCVFAVLLCAAGILLITKVDCFYSRYLMVAGMSVVRTGEKRGGDRKSAAFLLAKKKEENGWSEIEA